jgi:hypothetical protein
MELLLEKLAFPFYLQNSLTFSTQEVLHECLVDPYTPDIIKFHFLSQQLLFKNQSDLRIRPHNQLIFDKSVEFILNKKLERIFSCLKNFI